MAFILSLEKLSYHNFNSNYFSGTSYENVWGGDTDSKRRKGRGKPQRTRPGSQYYSHMEGDSKFKNNSEIQQYFS